MLYHPDRAGVDLSNKRRIIATCGSGVTATTLALGLLQCGVTNMSVYDGSWSEYGASTNPIATNK